MFLIIAITPETLPDSARRPFVWSSLNPFAFVQLLTARGAYRTSTDRPRIRALAAAKTLQMLPVFGVYDCEELFFRGELGMDAQAVGRFRSVRLTHLLPNLLRCKLCASASLWLLILACWGAAGWVRGGDARAARWPGRVRA